MKTVDYKDLEKYFTQPEIFSPMYEDTKIPRKLKKKVKKVCGIHWNLCTNSQRLWIYLGETNNNYKRYIIKQICKKY